MGRPLAIRRLLGQEPVAIGVASVVLLVAVLPPLLQIAGELLVSASSLRLLANGNLWWLWLRSVGLAGAVTLLALLVGVPLGVLFARAALPFRKVLLGAHCAVLLLPPFLPTLGWFHVFGRQGALGGVVSSQLLFSELGVVLVLATCLTPVVTYLTTVGVSGVDASLEEAALLSGGPWRCAALVLVPCALPIIALASIVVFVLAFSELGVPMFLRVPVYPTVVFARLGGMDFAPGEAAIFVVPLAVVALGLWWLERRFAGRQAIAALGVPRRPRTPLFAPRWSFLIAVGTAAAVSVVPIAALAARSTAGTSWADVTRWSGDAPWNSIRAGLGAAAVMTLIGLVLGHALAHHRTVGAWLDRVGMSAFLVPPSVLGVGIIAVWNRPSMTWLYASSGILVLGFVARYSALATRVFAASVLQTPENLENAACILGAGYFRRLQLVAALTPRGLVAAFVVGLVFALRDLETAVLFYPPGGETLTVRIFTLEANGPPGVVAALAVFHVGLTFAAVGGAWLAVRLGTSH
jgi:iron(III) transport system permease protein